MIASFHELAERELNEAAQFYSQQRTGLGAAFAAELRHWMTSCCSFRLFVASRPSRCWSRLAIMCWRAYLLPDGAARGLAYLATREEFFARVATRRRHREIGDPWCSCGECYVTNPDGTVTHRSMLPEDDPRRRPSATQR
jgi:hypothetical protein